LLPTPDAIHHLDENQSLPLHVACHTQCPVEVIQLLAPYGIVLHSANATGSIPIHAACGAGASLETAKLLVECGGWDTLRTWDHDGNLPLHLLCKTKPLVDVIQYLVKEYPGSVSVLTNDGKWPAQLAAKYFASKDMISELLKALPSALLFKKTKKSA